ncbi:recombinase family protein, partial [Rickettsiales endosymbiont of Peranema trichophorum]
MTRTKLELAQGALGKTSTRVSELCKELGITRQTLYRHVSPEGELRTDGLKLIKQKSR